MNLLLINHYAGTPSLGMEYRPYLLAREWVRQGHRVGILAATHSHVRTHQPAPGAEVIDGIEYRWLPTPAYAGNGVARLRNIMSFLQQAYALAPQLAAGFRPDAVISSSTYPMDTWVARRIARAAGAVLVHEIHDLWPLSPIELSGMSPWHPFALICQSAERAAFRHSDAIVSMLPKVRDHVQRHGGDPARLTIVPNGISPDDAKAPPPPLRDDVAQAIAAARAQQAVLVGYAGSMGEPNALDVLLDAARMLRDRPIRFVLVGDGHLRAHLAQRVAAEGHANVALLAPIPKAQVPSFLAAIDIAYIGWRRSPIYRFGIAPNKLMDYMLAGKTVLHSVQAGNDPVAEAGCGLTVEPESPEAVARGLRQLAALTPRERKVLGDKGRAHVRQHHAWPALARRFLGAIERARSARRADGASP
jgi:glycosyltransferase involved in cell wall biosynthesis